ncbi:MAG: tetratricopeptide repeat protein [Acidobacteriia bacterium]|nr:tetratricopeptide repeat protein [Terriglobia bacterium]
MAFSRPNILPAFLLFASLPALSQTYGIVEGYVDGPDGKPFEGAVVQFDRIWDAHLHYETKSDKKGYFRFLAIQPGTYALTATVNGQVRYKQPQMSVSPGRQTNVAGNLATNLHLRLKPAEAAAAEAKQEAAKDMTDEQKKQIDKAAEETKKKNAALMDSFAAGKQALASRNYDLALENLTKAAELDPRQAAVWSALSDTYLALGRAKPAEAAADYDKAREAFEKAIALAPADGSYWNSWALALAASNRMDEAKTALAKAIEVDPSGAGKYHYNLGVFLLGANKTQEALDAFKRAIAADPNYAEAHFQYGVAMLANATVDAAGKLVAPPGAVDSLQKYIALKPDGPNAKTAKDILSSLGR